jgi:hypothetical protein
MVVEEAKSFFEQQRLYIAVQNLLFMIRENPRISAEIFNFVQDPSPAFDRAIGDRTYLKIEPIVVEQMTQLMLDNPFPDTSKTHDSNLVFFNSLKAFHQMLNPASGQSKANNIYTRDHLKNHVAASLFTALIRSPEAQSYLRFIYRNIFSKINLIQLITFIYEKEA